MAIDLLLSVLCYYPVIIIAENECIFNGCFKEKQELYN
jgi:hypothetical protein